jgi:hypothetical protein
MVLRSIEFAVSAMQSEAIGTHLLGLVYLGSRPI